jgi:hypothetical protein
MALRISKMLLHPPVCEDSDCVHRQEGETKKGNATKFQMALRIILCITGRMGSATVTLQINTRHTALMETRHDVLMNFY